LYSVTLLLNLVIAFYYIIDFIDTVLSVYYVEKSRTTSRMPILARGTRRQQKVKVNRDIPSLFSYALFRYAELQRTLLGAFQSRFFPVRYSSTAAAARLLAVH